jgi:hypothetical protein
MFLGCARLNCHEAEMIARYRWTKLCTFVGTGLPCRSSTWQSMFLGCARLNCHAAEMISPGIAGLNCVHFWEQVCRADHQHGGQSIFSGCARLNCRAAEMSARYRRTNLCKFVGTGLPCRLSTWRATPRTRSSQRWSTDTSTSSSEVA